MGRPILLDTCALLWLANGDPISRGALDALATAEQEPGGLVVSPISAWEVGLLVSKARILLPLDPLVWFEQALGAGISLAEMTPGILVGSSFLPGSWLKDPADRIVAATARTLGYRIMTRDRPLLEFAAAGHAQAIAC